MKATDSYYPLVPTEPVNHQSIELGISIRDKIAHDYMIALMQYNGIYDDHNYMVQEAYSLADLFINTSNKLYIPNLNEQA